MPNLERKLERLDDAFLFLLGFVGLVITIIQVYLFGTSFVGFLETTPLLFLGIVMPFYVGFIRAAITIDVLDRSIVERMRGWVYLVIGVSAYLGHTISLHIPYNVIGISLPYNVLVVIGLLITYFLLKWLISVFQPAFRINDTHEYALSGTIVSALLFSFVFRMALSIYSDWQPAFQYSSLVMFFVWFTLNMTWLLFIYEKMSRNIVDANLPLSAAQLRRRQQRGLVVRFAMYYTDIFAFAWRISLKASFLFVQGSIIGLIGTLLLFLRIPVFSDLFLLTAIVLHFLGTIYFIKLRIDFAQLEV